MNFITNLNISDSTQIDDQLPERIENVKKRRFESTEGIPDIIQVKDQLPEKLINIKKSALSQVKPIQR